MSATPRQLIEHAIAHDLQGNITNYCIKHLRFIRRILDKQKISDTELEMHIQNLINICTMIYNEGEDIRKIHVITDTELYVLVQKLMALHADFVHTSREEFYALKSKLEKLNLLGLKSLSDNLEVVEESIVKSAKISRSYEYLERAERLLHPA